MNFQDIAQRFEVAESGTDSFKILYKDAFALMTEDPAHAAFYYVIGSAAHAYVITYEDQGVSPEFADRAKAVLVRFNASIVAALKAPAAEGLRILGEVASEYQFRVPEF